MIAIADVRRTPPLWGLSVGGISFVLLASVGGLVFTTLQGWSLWTVGTAVILPWVPVLVRDLGWIYKRYAWLAVFYALVVTQGGHCLEHIIQMVQIHVLGLTGANARGVFGVLDIEVVHLVWNTWVMLGVALLLWRFPANAALRLTALLAGWHTVEHAYIFSVYLSTGVSGTPGLLAQGGALFGGLPISRADLHCLYNLVESAPLFVGFFDQVRRSTRVDKSRTVTLQGAQSRV